LAALKNLQTLDLSWESRLFELKGLAASQGIQTLILVHAGVTDVGMKEVAG